MTDRREDGVAQGAELDPVIAGSDFDAVGCELGRKRFGHESVSSAVTKPEGFPATPRNGPLLSDSEGLLAVGAAL